MFIRILEVLELKRQDLVSFILWSIEGLSRNCKIHCARSGRADCSGSLLAALLRLREECFCTWHSLPPRQVNVLLWRQLSVHAAVQSTPKLLGNGACINFLDFSSISQWAAELLQSSLVPPSKQANKGGMPCSPAGTWAAFVSHLSTEFLLLLSLTGNW